MKYSLIHSSIHSFVHSFIHSFIYSFIITVRNHQYITFVTLNNRFCPLIAGNIKLVEYQTKSNDKYMPFLHCISAFKGITSYKNF